MWNSVIGQQRAKENLQRAIVTQKVAHAYCFWGPEGIGKDALAIEFARCLNCHRPHLDEDHNRIEACGECKSCKQSEHLQHPNIKLIFALPTGKATSGDEDNPAARLTEEQITALQEQLQLKAENPYHNFSMATATQIRIASIRDLKKSIQLSQSQEGRRVVIICEADQMTTEASNAFLKTLEEPQENVTIILCTSRKDQLPQTILSRCQQMQLDTLSDADISTALMQRIGLDEASSILCASLSHGSFSNALSMQDDDTKQQRNDVVDLLRSSMRSGAFRLDLMARIEELALNSDRAAIEKMLHLLLVWMRDAFVLSTSDNVESVINRDQLEVMKKFVHAYAHRDYPYALERIEECIRFIHGNGHIQLNLLSLMLTLREVFLSDALRTTYHQE